MDGDGKRVSPVGVLLESTGRIYSMIAEKIQLLVC
jgi:hypothetical protein